MDTHPIEKYLKENQLSKEWLAAALDVSLSTVNNMLKRDVYNNRYLIVQKLKDLGIINHI